MGFRDCVGTPLLPSRRKSGQRTTQIRIPCITRRGPKGPSSTRTQGGMPACWDGNGQNFGPVIISKQLVYTPFKIKIRYRQVRVYTVVYRRRLCREEYGPALPELLSIIAQYK